MWIPPGLIIAAWVAYCVFPAIEDWLQSRRDGKEMDAATKQFEDAHYWDEFSSRWKRKDGYPIK